MNNFKIMLSVQRHLFQLPDDTIYLNCAYMSPLLRSVEEAGMYGMARKRNPASVRPDDFFAGAVAVCAKFGDLINTRAERIAIIPSASYGLMAAVNNIPVNKGTHAITVSDEFPSDYYALKKWCGLNNKNLVTVTAPAGVLRRGKQWNERILEAINAETSAVVMSSVHWSDGTLFDLEKIGQRCKDVGALFIVDGTQSAGALEIDVQRCNISALICAAYKWLLGPYSIGVACYSEAFDNGAPLEESWLNRTNANDFSSLTQYADEYKPAAARYNMGEYSNFINMPMLDASLKQIAKWGVDNIQDYCRQLSKPLIDFLREHDFRVEEDAYRASHLFGFRLPEQMDTKTLLQTLQQRKIHVSLRGKSIRVAPHVYNTPAEIDQFIEALADVK